MTSSIFVLKCLQLCIVKDSRQKHCEDDNIVICSRIIPTIAFVSQDQTFIVEFNLLMNYLKNLPSSWITLSAVTLDTMVDKGNKVYRANNWNFFNVLHKVSLWPSLKLLNLLLEKLHLHQAKYTETAMPICQVWYRKATRTLHRSLNYLRWISHNLQLWWTVIFVANSVARSGSNLNRNRPNSIFIPEWGMYVDTLECSWILMNAYSHAYSVGLYIPRYMSHNHT